MKDTTSGLGIAGQAMTVITPWGRETYQVWLEQSPTGWIARIVTLPNRIWTGPGGREALKFHAATPDEAQKAALRFIHEERRVTGRRIAPPGMGAPKDAVLHLGSPPPPAKPARRLFRRFPLLFGGDRPERPGLTANISESGLFIITDRPAGPGSQLEIDLRFPDIPLLLGGEVVWVNERREPGRSVGCGVKLIKRSGEYLSRVRQLVPPGP